VNNLATATRLDTSRTHRLIAECPWSMR